MVKLQLTVVALGLLACAIPGGAFAPARWVGAARRTATSSQQRVRCTTTPTTPPPHYLKLPAIARHSFHHH